MPLGQFKPRYKPPSCGEKGGGQKNVHIGKTLRCVSQPKLARKLTTRIPTRKLALWPRQWCASGSKSNSLRPCEMKDRFSTGHLRLKVLSSPICPCCICCRNTILTTFAKFSRVHSSILNQAVARRPRYGSGRVCIRRFPHLCVAGAWSIEKRFKQFGACCFQMHWD